MKTKEGTLEHWNGNHVPSPSIWKFPFSAFHLEIKFLHLIII